MISKREAIIRARRSEAGLPVLLCPRCGKRGAHWVPAALLRPGHFVCKKTEVARRWEGGRG